MSVWLVLLYLGVVISVLHISRIQADVCPSQKFPCDGGRCIPTRWRCDDAVDCRDQTDEDNCDSVTCAPKYSRCGTGQCVPDSWWCDGEADCLDSSDEYRCGQTTTVTTTTVTTPTVAQTTSTQAAVTGAEVMLLSVMFDRWYSIPVTNGRLSGIATRLSVDSGAMGEVAGFDIHVSHRIVCWADQKWKTVMCGNMTETMGITAYRVLDSTSTGAGSPKGVAIDWSHNNVYWTDRVRGTVSVGSLDGKGRGKKTMVRDLDQPGEVVLDSRNRWMFLSEAYIRVVRYKLDGSDRTLLVERGIQRIKGLYLDFALDRIFWLDQRNLSISSCDLNGGKRYKHHTLPWKGYDGLAAFTDTSLNQTAVYFGQFHTGIISYVLGADHVTSVYDPSPSGYRLHVKVFNESSQPLSINQCEGNTCSHLCLPLAVGISYQCACPDKFLLDPDGETCRYHGVTKEPPSPCESTQFRCRGGKKCVRLNSVCNGRANCGDSSDEGPFCNGSTPYLITIETNTIKKTSLTDDNFTTSTSSGQNERFKNARALDVDTRRRQVYFAVKNSILRADMTASAEVQSVSTVIQQASADIVDLSVDWLHGLLYWVDGYHNSVSVSTEDGAFTQLLVRERGPNAIAVDPVHGWFFLADKPPNGRAQLLRFGMDGKSRSVIMPDLGFIGSIAIDFQSENVLWTDHIIKALMSLPVSGRGGLDVRSDPQQGTMSGLSVHQHWVYVSDRHKNTVRRYRESGKLWEDVRHNADSPIDTAVLDMSSQPMVKTRCGRNNGGCYHVCIPTPTDRVCACPPPSATSGPSCHFQDMLLVSKPQTVTRVNLNTPDGEFFSSKILQIPAEGTNFNSSAVLFDVDVRNNAVFWTDSNLGYIYMTRFKAELEFDVCERVFSRNVARPESLAVDWIHQNVYWSDTIRHTISIGSIQTRAEKTLIDSNLGLVRGMAVEPRTRWLYWTNRGELMYSKVERCRLDGSHRQDVIASGLYTPTGLAIDYDDNRLFVGDAGRGIILSCNMTGNGCYTLSTSKTLVEISSVTLYRDFVYWVDPIGKRAMRMRKNTGEMKDSVAEFVTSKPLGVVVFHPDRQPIVPSACGSDNGGCLLCLPKAGGSFKCGCPDGRWLSENGKSCSIQAECKPGYKRLSSQQDMCVYVDECDESDVCSHICTNTQGHITCSCRQGYELFNETKCRLQGPPPSMLLVDGRRLLFVDRFDFPKPRVVKGVLPRTSNHKTGLRRPVAADVDVAGQRIFWADKKLDTINIAELRGKVISSPRVLVNTGVKSPQSVAYDWIYDSLYWVDSGVGAIRMVTLQTNFTWTVHRGLNRPRAVALDPNHGSLYWTSWGRFPSIERSGMDGSERMVIVSTNIVWPNGLTIDYSERRLYWTDGHMGVVSSSDMDGRSRRVVIFRHGEQPQQMFSVAVIEDFVYWTDWRMRYLRRVGKTGTQFKTFTSVALRRPTDAKVIHPSRQVKGTNRCGRNNGGCSHICSPAPLGGKKSFACRCPDNMTLKTDGITCTTSMG